jgi:hypothetical protein
MVFLNDRLTFDKDARICADGCLVAEVFAARTGLQDYMGYEIDPTGSRFARDAVVKVYRPESEVFKTDSLATFAGAPVTVEHPSEAVTADNWKRLGVGEIHGEIARDGQRVRVPIIIRDADAVRAATSTHKQLSMGYATELVFPQDGKHPDGTACDAYQTNLKINHIALVRAARGGPELRVVDERAPAQETKIVKTIIVDGLPVNLGDVAAVEAVLAKKDAAVADSAKELTDAKAQVATLTAEKTALEKQLADAQAVDHDKLAADRAALVAKAKSLKSDIVTDGKSSDEIRKEIVTAQLGDAAAAFDGKQIEAAFAVIAKDAKADENKVVPIGQPKSVVVDAAMTSNIIRNARYS